MTTSTIVAAADTFANLMADDADMMSDTMQSLQCIEADALVALVRACGYEDAADTLAEAHADGDELGDDHYPETITETVATDLVIDSHFRIAEGDDYRDTFVALDVDRGEKGTVIVKADREGHKFTLSLAPETPVHLVTYPKDEI